MNRRTALSALAGALFVAALPAHPSAPRRLALASTGAIPRRMATITGTDARGNRISEEIPWPEEGGELVSTLSYATWSLTIPGLGTSAAAPVSFGFAQE